MRHLPLFYNVVHLYDWKTRLWSAILDRFCTQRLHTAGCIAALERQMSGPLEPGNPSSSSDVRRRPVMKVGRPSIIVLRCGGSIDGVWWSDEKIVKQDDLWCSSRLVLVWFGLQARPQVYQALVEVHDLNSTGCICILGDNSLDRRLFFQNFHPPNRFITGRAPGCKGQLF